MPGPNITDITNQLEHGVRQDFDQSLTSAYNSMSHGDFKSMLNKLKQQSDADVKAHPNLPGIELGTDSVGRPQISVTTPGKYLGNHWRNTEVAWTANTLGSDVKSLIIDSHVASNNASAKNSRSVAESIALGHEADFNEKQGNVQAAVTLHDSAILSAKQGSSKTGRTFASIYALDSKADFLDRQGDTEGARKIYEQADELGFGISHDEFRAMSTSYALDAHAEFLEKHGKTEDAAKLYDRAILSARSTEDPDFGNNCFATATSFAKIERAGFLDRSGRVPEAAKLFDEAIDASKKAYNNDGAALIKSVAIDAKAQFLEHHGKISEASQLYVDALTAANTAGSGLDPDPRQLLRAKTLESAGAFFERMGNAPIASMMYDQAYDSADQIKERNSYAIAASSATTARYEFVGRQQSGTAAPFLDLPKSYAAQAFQTNVAWTFLSPVR